MNAPQTAAAKAALAAPQFNFVILYVADVARSAAFYAEALQRPVVEDSPTFAIISLQDGTMLGLWKRGEVQPAASGGPGASETCFRLADEAAVRATHDAWKKRGVAIAQAPTLMDFGTTFVALDPDGHRVRVYVPQG
ncbi:MAG: VOC family protein [Bauldia sp.]